MSSGRPLGDQRAAGVARFRAQVDDPVGALDDVEVVLDDDHGVSRVHQPVEHLDQHAHVVEVQAGRRLVENVELPAARACRRCGELARDLEPLRLAARERGGGLAQPEVAEPDLLELPERGAELRLVAEAA